MEVAFSDQAGTVEDDFYASGGPEYERLWEVLDRIREDPDEAMHANWTNYVSTFRLWGSKIPGTEYTVFWRVTDGPSLSVAEILRDPPA